MRMVMWMVEPNPPCKKQWVLRLDCVSLLRNNVILVEGDIPINCEVSVLISQSISSLVVV
jgi:hypothetical protein